MSRSFCDRYLMVQRIFDETAETRSFTFDLSSEPFLFEPGQFVNVTAEIPEKGRIRRAYSIASSPLDPELQLTVKRMEAGLLSKYLCDALRPGDLLHVRGPYGRFTLHKEARHVVFIAGLMDLQVERERIKAERYAESGHSWGCISSMAAVSSSSLRKNA